MEFVWFFPVVLAFVSVLGKTKTAAPNCVTGLTRRPFFEKPILRSNPQGSLLTRLQVFDIIALLGNVSQGDGADESPLRWNLVRGWGVLLEGKLCFIFLWSVFVPNCTMREAAGCLCVCGSVCEILLWLVGACGVVAGLRTRKMISEEKHKKSIISYLFYMFCSLEFMPNVF